MPNKIPSWIFKLMMNLYPPFLFGRVRIQKVSKDYKNVEVCIKKSLLNKNLSGTLFGGTLFSAADPFYALMYWQNFAHQFNWKVRVWLKSAEIKYKKPAVGNMYLQFILSQEAIEAAKADLEIQGKHNQNHEVLIKNKAGEVCAVVNLVTYVGKN
jgi:acyl-coenzyme A thioesterase PaaI-like protein